MKSILLAAMMAANVGVAAELSPKFVRAVHMVETGGRTGAIKGDGGKALGPLQIHYAYWADSGLPGKYEDCADYKYSVRVMTAVLNKYAPKAVQRSDYKTLARVHNGGPAGFRMRATLPYWNKVQRYL